MNKQKPVSILAVFFIKFILTNYRCSKSFEPKLFRP